VELVDQHIIKMHSKQDDLVDETPYCQLLLKRQWKEKRDPSTSFVICLQGSWNAEVERWQITHSAQDDIF
jgi:hypothetical protein